MTFVLLLVLLFDGPRPLQNRRGILSSGSMRSYRDDEPWFATLGTPTAQVEALAMLRMLASIVHHQGNKLSIDCTRKTMVLSFSFLELGQSAISDGSGWLTPVVIRDAIAAEVVRGVGCGPPSKRYRLRRQY